MVVLERPKRGLPWRYIAPFAAFFALMALIAMNGLAGPGLSVTPSAPGTVTASDAPSSTAVPTPTPVRTDNPDAVLAAGQLALNKLQARLSALDVSCSSKQDAAYTKCTAAWDELDAAWNRLSACVDQATTFAQERACESAIPAP